MGSEICIRDRDKKKGKKCDTPNHQARPELRRSETSQLSEDEDLIGWCIIGSIPGLAASEQYIVLGDERSSLLPGSKN